MANDATFTKVVSFSRPDSSVLSTCLSREGGADLMQCISFQDGEIVRTTGGSRPTRTLELCGKETAAGLFLTATATRKIIYEQSLAVSYREGRDPITERLDSLFHLKIVDGTLEDGTKVQILIHGLKESTENGIETRASGAFVWPSNKETLVENIGARRLVYL